MGSATKRRARLAITGSAGVGKTTLGRRLAEILAVPFLEEGMRARTEVGLDLHMLDSGGRRALLLEVFEQTLSATCAAVGAAGGFVSDRCSMDFAAFWLYYGFAFDEDATQRVFARAEAALAGYDLIAVLPWGAIPLVPDGVRSANPWLQLHYQVLLEGLLARWGHTNRVVKLPAEVVGIEGASDGSARTSQSFSKQHRSLTVRSSRRGRRARSGRE